MAADASRGMADTMALAYNARSLLWRIKFEEWAAACKSNLTFL